MTSTLTQSAEMTEPGRSPRRRRRRTVGTLVTVAAAGTAVFAIARSRSADNDQVGYAPPVSLVGVEPGAPVDVSGEAPLPAPPATAADTVAAFLDAEIASDPAASYALLDEASRSQAGGLSGWEAGFDDHPAYLSYRIVTTDDDGRVTVAVEAKPRVSEVSGVVIARSTMLLATTPEAGGRRIALGDSSVEPEYPTADPSAAALAWIAAAKRCEPEGAPAYGEFEGTVVGTIDAGAGWCGATDAPSVTAAGGLDLLADPGPMLGQFGASASEWARVTRIAGSAAAGRSGLDVVVAPFGETWVVVGVFATLSD